MKTLPLQGKGRGLKRFINIFWGLLVALVLATVITYGLLHVPFVQTGIVKAFTSVLYFGKGVDISVGKVDFVPIRSLKLQDLLIRDFKGDTLLSSNELELQIGSIDFVKRDMQISSVKFTGAEFVVWRDADTNAVSRTNISRLIDSLRGGPKKVVDTIVNKTVLDTLKQRNIQNAKSWFVNLKRVEIRDSRFRYINSLYVPRDYGVNWTDIDCLHWNAELSNIHFGDTATFSVRNMNFTEKSGLQCKNIQGDLHFMKEHVMVTNAQIALKESDVSLSRISFQWDSRVRKSWGDYCKKIFQTYLIKDGSYVNFRDIAYFNGKLRGIENTVYVSGVVDNTIDRLQGRNLRLGIDRDTRFRGSFKTYGLPYVDTTVFDIDIVDGYFSPHELATVYLPWFKRHIPVPSPIKNFKMIRGDFLNFDGTFTEFDVKARTNTNGFKGDISVSMGRSETQGIEISDFWGNFSMSQVDMGVLTGVDDLGEASLYGEFSGARDSLNIYTGVQTEWPYIVLGNDKIQNLSAYIMLDNNVNHILAQTDDNGVFADVVMTIESDSETAATAFDFVSATASVYVDNLSRFGYSIADSAETVGVNAKYLAAGTNDNRYNRLYLSDIAYSNSRGAFVIDTLLAELQTDGGRQELMLNSELVSMYAEGHLMDIYNKKLWNKFYTHYIPALNPSVKTSRQRPTDKLFDELDFRAYIIGMEVDTVTQILNPNYYIENNTMVRMDFTDRDSLSVMVVSDSLRFDLLQVSALDLKLNGSVDSLYARVDAESIKVDTIVSMYNLMNETSAVNNMVHNRIFWSNWGEQSYSGDIRFDVKFSRDPVSNELCSDMKLYDGVMVFGDSVWNIAASNVALRGRELQVDHFSINKGSSFVHLNGALAKESTKQMAIDVNDISLRRLSMFVPGMQRANLFGNLSGNCIISDYTAGQDNYFEVGIQLDDWGIGVDTLGVLSVNSIWDKESQNLILRGENRYDRNIPFSLYATYSPDTDSLDMEVQLQTVRINRLNDYFGEYITGSSGGISGEVMCIGTLDNPQFFGSIYLDSVQMMVNALGTSFMINDNLSIQGNKVDFKDFVMHDVNGDIATLNGYYELFNNRYDVSLLTDRFTVMNTNSSYNDSFYGRLCIGGYAHADNLNGETNLAVDWMTAGSSMLYLPLVSGVNDDAGILTFVAPREQIDVQEERTTFSGLNLDANIEVNDNLEVQLIFDPSIGDLLTCSGNGNLKFTIDQNDNLGMSGEYEVIDGDYLFTLGGIWNKHFILEQGGTIIWNGTPYDATLNLSAEYNLRTSLYELYASAGSYDQTENSDIRRKVPVQCKLKLTDKLTNPVIGMDIDFPTLDNHTKSYIKNMFSTQDEINKQVFSLMVMNKFTAPDYLASSSIANQAGAAGITTLTELVSTKLSKWISKFSNNFDLGVTYRMGDEITSDELELALSTRLFNDRMTISANGNVNMNNNSAAMVETNSNQLAGDFDVDVKLNKQGTLHLKAYSHTDEKILYYSTETIQGIGLSYQSEFDTFKELIRRYVSFFKKKKDKK